MSGNHRLKGVSDNVMFDKRVTQTVASPPEVVCTHKYEKRFISVLRPDYI